MVWVNNQLWKKKKKNKIPLNDETDDETDEKQPDTTDLPDLESEESAEQRN